MSLILHTSDTEAWRRICMVTSVVVKSEGDIEALGFPFSFLGRRGPLVLPIADLQENSGSLI